MNLFENLCIMKESDNILFSFNWKKGSINDNIIKYLKSKNIQFRYNGNFQLEAKIKGNWVRFDYEKKDDGLTYIYIGSKNNKVTESILSFDDWLDKNFDNLVYKYAEKYEIDEYEVRREDEDFEDFCNDEYENYYRNTNRYLDDEEIEEDF